MKTKLYQYRSNARLSISFGALLFAAPVCLGQNINIDDFLSSSGTSALRPSAGQTASAVINNVGTIGGFRSVSLTNNTSVNSTSFIFSDVPLPAPNSGRTYGAGLSQPQVGSVDQDSKFTLRYDANGSGLGLDLTNQSSFELLWDGDNFGRFNESSLALRLTDSGGSSHEETFTWLPGVNPLFLFVETTRWELSDYSSSVDLSAIDRIELIGDTDQGSDIVFTSLTAVPEPSTALFSGFSLGFLVLRRRR